jgi:ubiquinone biosynthesis protein
MSEQLGLRKIAKSLKTELPFILKTAPEMPRLIHRWLNQQTGPEQEAPLNSDINKLIIVQQQQAKWQKFLTISLVVIAILQIVFIAVTVLN